MFSEQLTEKTAAELITLRCAAARQRRSAPVDWRETLADMLQKRADWREQASNIWKNLTTAKPGAPSDPNFWKNTGWEAARNALLGGGVGAGVGLASDAFGPRRKSQPGLRALQGALLGGAVGAGGTGVVRGLQTVNAELPGDAMAKERIIQKRREHGLPDEPSAGPGLPIPERVRRAYDIYTNVDNATPLEVARPLAPNPTMGVVGGLAGGTAAAMHRGGHTWSFNPFERSRINTWAKSTNASKVLGGADGIDANALKRIKELGWDRARPTLDARQRAAVRSAQRSGKLQTFLQLLMPLAGAIYGSGIGGQPGPRE